MKYLLALVVIAFLYFAQSTTETTENTAPVKKTAAQECDYALKMGAMQENAAAEAYESVDLVKTRHHLKMALSNYMSGFKPCLNTPKEDQLINSNARVNGILTDKNFNNAVKLQKFFKQAK